MLWRLKLGRPVVRLAPPELAPLALQMLSLPSPDEVGPSMSVSCSSLVRNRGTPGQTQQLRHLFTNLDGIAIF